MVEADQSQEGKVRQNFKVTLLAGIVTREVTLAISARHQRRTSLTKTRSVMMMNPQMHQLMNLMMHSFAAWIVLLIYGLWTQVRRSTPLPLRIYCLTIFLEGLGKFTLHMENLLTFLEEVILTSRPPVDPYGHCTLSDIFLP